MTANEMDEWAALEAADSLALTYEPVIDADSERLAREAHTLGILLAGFEALDADADHDPDECICGLTPCCCRWAP